ncbi:DUF86 domain-containing protein [soil metagenome]
MKRGDKAYLLHILDAVMQIQTYTVHGKNDFFSSRLVQDAVIRNLEIIGEATKNLSPTLRERQLGLPWKQMAGLRDVLIHPYFGSNLETVWLVVENRLPVLLEAVQSLLADEAPE